MLFRLILSLIFITSVSACSWWGGEKHDGSTLKLDEGEVLGKSTDCIDETGTFFFNYFKGTTTDADIQRNFKCVVDTIDVIFENANEQQPQKGFSRDEMSKIFTTIFPNKDKEFLTDNIEILFLIKRVFVGGLIDGFSRLDHKNLKEALPKVQKEFSASKKAIAHLFYGEDKTFESRSEGLEQLNKSFRALDKVKSDYKGELTEPEGRSVVTQIFKQQTLKRFVKLALVAKTFVFNNDPKVFLVSQKDFFERLIRVLEAQARLRSLDFSKGFLFGKSYYDLKHAVLLVGASFLKWSKAVKTRKHHFKISICVDRG